MYDMCVCVCVHTHTYNTHTHTYKRNSGHSKEFVVCICMTCVCVCVYTHILTIRTRTHTYATQDIAKSLWCVYVWHVCVYVCVHTHTYNTHTHTYKRNSGHSNVAACQRQGVAGQRWIHLRLPGRRRRCTPALIYKAHLFVIRHVLSIHIQSTSVLYLTYLEANSTRVDTRAKASRALVRLSVLWISFILFLFRCDLGDILWQCRGHSHEPFTLVGQSPHSHCRRQLLPGDLA
jgi:Ca2+/H+ antiporter